MSKYGIFSGPYFPVFGLNTEIYGVNSPIMGKRGLGKALYLATFHAVTMLLTSLWCFFLLTLSRFDLYFCCFHC